MLTRLVHLAARGRAMFRPTPLDRDLDAEHAAHVALLADEYVRRGMAPADAERAARMAVGGLTQLRDAHRETRSLPAIETLMRDLRFAFRTLRRDAGFTTFAILIVGLGIGASATVFSVLNTLILRPLPYAHADRLVWSWNLSDDRISEWSWQLPASFGGASGASGGMSVHDALKESARGSTHGAGRSWIRGALAVSEIALACVLLIGAGLLIRSLLHVLDVDLGYQPTRAASMRVDPRRRLTTQEQRNVYYGEMLEKVRAIPGVRAAGLTDVLPLGGERSWHIAGRGQVYARGHFPEGFVRIVSDGYFETLGLRLIAGRQFNEYDTKGSDRVIIVNETLARTLWPGQDPIGQVMTQDGGRRVIGLVGDVRQRGLEQAPGAEMYIPIRQSNNYNAVHLVVRTDLPEAGLAAAVRAALAPVDPNLPRTSGARFSTWSTRQSRRAASSCGC
jgi:hypothetical protein